LTARIEPGSKLEIKCTPPQAQPEAQTSWLKNNENIPTSTSSVTITKEGNLIINSAKSQVRATWST
jgi:TusA-related sulfurtransferase